MSGEFPRELDPRSAALVAALRRDRSTWLWVGRIPTMPSARGYLRAGFEELWEYYEENTAGEVWLGVAVHHLDTFGSHGVLHGLALSQPEREPAAIPEATMARIRSLDATFSEAWGKLASGACAIRREGSALLVCTDGELFRIRLSADGEAAEVARALRGLAVHVLRKELWDGTAPDVVPAGALHEKVRGALDPAALLDAVVSGRAKATVSEVEEGPFYHASFDRSERSVYRRADGELVEHAPTGAWEVMYPGYPPWADEVEGPVYAESSCTRERVAELVRAPWRTLQVRFGGPFTADD